MKKSLDQLLRQGLQRRAEIAASEYPPAIETVALENLDLHIATSRPCLLPSLLDVNVDSLLTEIAATQVSVALTPLGNADSPLGTYFVKPHIEQMTVATLLALLEARSSTEGPHFYMQSQDDNRNKEFSHLPETLIPKSLKIPESKLLGPIEAVNLWIGGGGTTSRLHNDNYDNIYVQLRGTKRIWLIPPAEVDATQERFLEAATYRLENDELILKRDEPRSTVLFPTCDPRCPDFKPTTMFMVDLNPGQVLFMPALWYHQIEIMDDNLNVSVNYWHTPNPSDAWANWDFLRWTSLALRKEYDEVYFADPDISSDGD